jgi:hypothetical protein
MKSLELAGRRFGRLTVIAEAGRDKHGNILWKCRCECGSEKKLMGFTLVNGHTKSCGCLACELSAQRFTTHGESKRTPEYEAWVSSKQRCTNPNNPRYADYGGRGISVCPRWADSFESFLADMGRRPSPQHSLGRVLDRGNYELGNAFWMSRAEQSLNKRNNHALDNWEGSGLARAA